MGNCDLMNGTTEHGEIVVYQPDEVTRLEVRVSDETVWLTQAQMSELFGRERTVITKHIRNIFAEHELDEKSNVQFLHFANSDKPVKIFSLDVIISVGYRVKSLQGTYFRQWANKILKEYLLHCSSVHQRLTLIEYRLSEHDRKIDFFVRTSLPPVEGIFYDGQIFDAAALILSRSIPARAPAQISSIIPSSDTTTNVGTPRVSNRLNKPSDPLSSLNSGQIAGRAFEPTFHEVSPSRFNPTISTGL